MFVTEPRLGPLELNLRHQGGASIGWIRAGDNRLIRLPLSHAPKRDREQQHTDETVKVCAYNFSESAFLQATQAIIELTLRTI